MSNHYMRQIMESISRAQMVNEGYEDRVNAVVSQISKNNSEGLTRKAFDSEFKRAAQVINPVEMRGSPKALADFKKDVLAKVTFKRDTSAADSNRERSARALEQLADIIADAAGNSFPDGDPFDTIFPKARRMGIPPDSVIDWLDRAVKKAGMGKSYHDYLANLWDENIEDYNDMNGTTHHNRNPWR
jgi:hypothetical protein